MRSGFRLLPDGARRRRAARILERNGLASKRFLAVTLRLSARGSQKNLPPEAHASYARKIAEFVSLWTRNEPSPVVFVCQVPKDVEDTRFVLSQLSDGERAKCVVLEHIAAPELLTALYAHAGAVVGMRFHSLIFALSAKIPAMGVYYYDIGPKIQGLMDDLGYPEYAVSLAEADGRSSTNWRRGFARRGCRFESPDGQDLVSEEDVPECDPGSDPDRAALACLP